MINVNALETRRKRIADSFEEIVTNDLSAVSKIATIETVDADSILVKYPIRLTSGKIKKGADVKDDNGYKTEFDVEPIVTKSEAVELDIQISNTRLIDPINSKMNSPLFEPTAIREAKEKLLSDFHYSVITEALAQAGTLNNVDATIDTADKANVLGTEILKQMGAFAKPDEIKVITNYTTYGNIVDALIERQTELGDDAFINYSGFLKGGVEVLPVAKNIAVYNDLGEVVPDDTKIIIDDGKVLVVAKKAIDVKKTSLQTEEVPVPSSASTKVNVQKAIVDFFFMAVRVFANKKHLVKKN